MKQDENGGGLLKISETKNSKTDFHTKQYQKLKKKKKTGGFHLSCELVVQVMPT